MAEIINLNRARKARAAADKKATAAANRSKHGRTKVEKDLNDAERDLRSDKLDAHRRERPEDDDSNGEPEPA